MKGEEIWIKRNKKETLAQNYSETRKTSSILVNGKNEVEQIKEIMEAFAHLKPEINDSETQWNI